LEAILLQHGRIRRIGDGGIGTLGNGPFHLPASKLGGKNRGRRGRGRWDRDRRRRANSQGRSAKNGANNGEDEDVELPREFHSKSAHMCYRIRLPASQESFHRGGVDGANPRLRLARGRSVSKLTVAN